MGDQTNTATRTWEQPTRKDSMVDSIGADREDRAKDSFSGVAGEILQNFGKADGQKDLSVSTTT